MDVNGMTLEGFFLADYERLRRENGELRDKLDALTDASKPSRFGLFDLERKTDAVKMSVDSLYYAGKCVGLSLDDLKRASEMDDETLLSWAQMTYRNEDSYYTSCTPISIDRHTYQYTIRIVETRSDSVLVTDGTDGSELIDLNDMSEDMSRNLGEWCDAKYEDKLKAAAIELLRKRIDDAIRKLGGE